MPEPKEEIKQFNSEVNPTKEPEKVLHPDTDLQKEIFEEIPEKTTETEKPAQPTEPQKTVQPTDDKTEDKSTKQKITDIKEMERPRQIEALTDLALEKGVHYAVDIAKKIDNAYVLDEFHDTLVDHLYEELKKRDSV